MSEEIRRVLANIAAIKSVNDSSEEIESLRQQVEELTRERDKHKKRKESLVGHMKWCVKVEERNEKLCEALEFYANKENHNLLYTREDKNGMHWWVCPIDEDKGNKAQQALQTIKEDINRATEADDDGIGYCRYCGTTIGESHHSTCDKSDNNLESTLSPDQEDKCEHGKGLNDYCQLCGRIHSG